MSARVLVVALAVLFTASAADALPMFAMRSGRTCGNCHVSPTYQDASGWDNPALEKRKCNLSCVVCHVNPSGGGLRNASGKYYGDSTLSMFTTTERSYSDYSREWLKPGLLRQSIKDLGVDLFDQSASDIPSDFDDVKRGFGAFESWNRPLLHSDGELSYWDGRYGHHVADPLLNIGGDFRLGAWSGSRSVFPMQADLSVAIHPVEHITAMATVAAQGRSGGFKDTINAAQKRSPVFLRNAFLMVHELPMMGTVKAGIFQPAFGTHIDDHTSPIRRDFEMDVSTPDDTVVGVEGALFPNYPFLIASVFRNMPMQDAPDVDPGYGGALQLGWRDLGWSLTAHAMSKRRPIEARGDLDAAGVSWGFNPAYYWEPVPLTYMGELSVAHKSGQVNWAMYHEAWWLLMNGLNVRGKVDVSQRSTSGPVTVRNSLSLDVSPIPGLTTTLQARHFLEPGRQGVDFFGQVHVWF